MSFQKIQLVNVGDKGVGKRALLMTYTTGSFPDYIPAVFENYNYFTEIDGKKYQIELWDTNGQEEYDNLRPLNYPSTNILLLHFSIDSPRSFESISSKWKPEVEHFIPNIPFILVGLKSDLREDKEYLKQLEEQGIKPITKEQGEAKAKEIGAAKYIECSAKNNFNVRYAIEEAVRNAKEDNFSDSSDSYEESDDE